jgi:hypothetical protein
MVMSPSVLLRMRNVSDKILRENENTHFVFVGRDGSVSIATLYGRDGLGIECRWRRDFPHPPIPALEPTQPPTQWVPGLSGGYRDRDMVLTTDPYLEPKLKIV